MTHPSAPRPPEHDPAPDECAEVLGGTADDWARLREAWGERFMARMQLIADERMNMRVRMLGGTQVGYQRMTRRWWQPVFLTLAERGLGDCPLYFVSSNTHSLVNIATGVARERDLHLDVLASGLLDLGPDAKVICVCSQVAAHLGILAYWVRSEDGGTRPFNRM